ncbi:hypothetical protein [Ligilactobacillus apodemi]|uniref:hypothetical protein n=1 Tax=Ligilactobacillus apodemi TaxID=307126 RepID=UPI00214CAF55|nr:hypothetical protein [Ligilactobacillus apodemi]MCR1902259.1 hypothetical protein [Ligilactobacillus apodemi]
MNDLGNALEQVIDLTRKAYEQKTVNVDGYQYEVNGNGLTLLDNPEFPKERVSLSTLTGLVDFIEREGNDGMMLVVKSPTEVQLVGMLDDQGKRPTFAVARADVPEFRYERWYGQSELIIALQATFVDNSKTDKDVVLQVVGNLKESHVNQASDDGVSQSVQINTGVASVATARVPNPVTLQPYRTFLEVKQPESKFVFRMREGMEAALFEADGGMWKIEAKQAIKEYLEDKLESLDIKMSVIA